MNTVSKGNNFEDRVFAYLKEELENDKLHVLGKRSVIYKKKGYYSKDRDANITVDISIETFLDGANDYSLLTIIECKDYKNAIPVDDIEEFNSKIQQITGANTKAIFVTSNALQASAFQYAKSRKIGVVRYMPNEQIEWLTHANDIYTARMKPHNSNQESDALTEQDFISTANEFYGYNSGNYYLSLASFLFALLSEK